jgi:plasmid replication initiation protein
MPACSGADGLLPVRRPPASSERLRLSPFDALPDEGPPRRDQRDLMERPFFSLAKGRRVTPILYRAGDIEVQVHAVPEHGMATIWDADVLIWAGSQIVDAADRGLATSRFLRFTPYQLLTAIGRGTGLQQYTLLKAALGRLQSTVIRTTIRQEAHWRRQQFSWISEWEERVTASGRCEGMEFVLPEWFHRGVLDRQLVLTIDPAYFRLTGGIERWLYRVARKHAGHQPQGWAFEFRHLHVKSGSLARFADFALDLRRIAARQPLPGYRLSIRNAAAAAQVLHISPTPACGQTVDKPALPVDGHGISGAAGIGISGATASADQAQKRPINHCGDAGIRPPNESNSDSNLQVVVGPPLSGESDRDGGPEAAP